MVDRRPKVLLYADRLFLTNDGKTSHGLVRRSMRYDVVGVVDTTLPPGDAGAALDGKHRGIPLFSSLEEGLEATGAEKLVVGAVCEGLRLPEGYDAAVEAALGRGVDIVSGLHYFLSDVPRFSRLAEENGCDILDVRKMFRDRRRFYTGEIKDVGATRVSLVGTDSAIGKRTTSVLLVAELCRRGYKADMIYTGQTGWMQGWPHGVIMDALINDFVSGAIEGAVLECWKECRPEFMVIEGQGSPVHPFFPGGFEILAAGQVHGFLLQDAPGRPNLDGFPGYPMPDPERVVRVAELICEQRLLGIGLNHENLTPEEANAAADSLRSRLNVPVEDPIAHGVSELADAVEALRG